jgi:hypothetical protein
MSNYFSKDSCVHNSDYRCFSCLLRFGRSGEHLKSTEETVKVLSAEKEQSARKRPVLHLWQPPLCEAKKPCLDRCVCV